MPLLKRSGQPTQAGLSSPQLPGAPSQPDPIQHGEQQSPPRTTRTFQTSLQGTASTLQQGPNTTQTLQAGTILQHRYLIEQILGMGGMSTVYLGRDLRFRDVVRACAIKEMHQTSSDSQTRLLKLSLFEREAALLATLSHPAIPKVYDFFEESGKAYLVIELIPGRDLASTLEHLGRPVDEASIIHWAVQICNVLAYLHQHEPEPVVFRDMKPSNIIVTPEERIVVVDFGIARLFKESETRGTIIGTEGYAPPEQYRGVVHPLGDIYSLGATLHHLLTGIDPRTEPPFTFQERAIHTYNAAISPQLEGIVMRALQYDAGARFQSAQEMRAHLLALSGATPAEQATIRLTTQSSMGSTTRSPELIWKFGTDDEVRSSPAVRDRNLFIGSYDRHLYCLNAATGEMRWKRATAGGVSASPAIAGDQIIVGSEDGQIYSIDVRRGTIRWSYRTEGAVRSSPRVHDRLVYVGSDDQQVYALDSQSGRKLWQFRTWMAVRSSCTVGDDAVYVGSSDGHLYCIDALKGTMRWKQRTQQGIISTPAVSDGVVYVGSMDGHLYALDAEGGWVIWRYKTGRYVNSSPLVVGKRIYVGGVDGNMYAFDTTGGKLVWTYEAGTQITSSPRFDNNFIYFGGIDGAAYKLDAQHGTLVWKYQTGGPIVSSPAIADEKVFFGSLDRYVYAIANS